MSKEMRVPAVTCVGCGALNDGATPLEGEEPVAPVPGNLIICASCGALMAIVEPGVPHVERVTPEAFLQLDERTQALLQRARQRIMDHNFLHETMRPFSGPDAEREVAEAAAEAAARGKIAVLFGSPCSKGPPPRKMRPARKERCPCGVRIWVNAKAPSLPVCCPDCGAKMLERERRLHHSQ